MNNPRRHWEPALDNQADHCWHPRTVSWDLHQVTLMAEWLPLWKPRHEDLFLALSLSGNAKPSHPVVISSSTSGHLPSWIYQSRGTRLASASQEVQKPRSPVVFDVVFHLIEAHVVAQGKVVGVSLHRGAPVHL